MRLRCILEQSHARACAKFRQRIHVSRLAVEVHCDHGCRAWAERIGHGVSAVHDPDLVTYLADNRITLEMCPTSNIRTRAVPSLAEHPMPALLAAGVPVCLNTDDPGMFNTTLNTEYAVVHEAFGIDPAGLAELARTGVRASYAGDATKQRMLAGIDAHAAGSGQPAVPSPAAIQQRR